MSSQTLPGWGDPDGSDALFAQLDGDPESYAQVAEEHYEREVDRDALAHVFARRPPTRKVVEALNPGRYGAALLTELTDVGYPGTPSNG